MTLPPQNVLDLLLNPPASEELYPDEAIKVLADYINEASDEMAMTLWTWIQRQSADILFQIHPYIEMKMVETSRKWEDEDKQRTIPVCREMLEAAGVKFRPHKKY